LPAACTHVATVPNPAHYIQANTPTHVWVVRANVDSSVRMDLPEVRGSVLSGWVAGHRESVALVNVTGVRAVRPAPIRSAVLTAVVVSAAYVLASHASSSGPTRPPIVPNCDCNGSSTCC